MTIYIAHRQNSKKSLLKKNEYFSDGLEIDLRSNSNKIIMSHDPFKKGLDFVKNIKFLKNNFLLIDIKSTGIYKKVIQILKKKKNKVFIFKLNIFRICGNDKSWFKQELAIKIFVLRKY